MAALEPNRFRSLTLANSLTQLGDIFKPKTEEDALRFFSDIIDGDFENLNIINSTSGYESDHRLLNKSNNVDPFLFFKYSGEFSDLSTLDLLDKINLPCMVIYGDRDTVVDKKEQELLYSKIQNCARHEIKGAGHFSFATHSDEFNDTVIGFIESIRNK